MASNIPTRRVMRTTRTTTLKDNENANARPSRLTARVKPPSSNGSAKANGNDENKVNLATQGKRKCEALGEVTRFVNKNKTTNIPAKEVKGKRKEADPVKEVKEKFDGIVIKSKPSLVAAARQPLCTVSGSTTHLATRSTVVAPQAQNLDKVKEESGKVADEDAMAIDDHPTTNAAPSAEPQPRRVSMRPPAKHEDDIEDNCVFKKRRTSSDIPDEVKLFEQEQLQQEAEEAALEAYANSEPEADPYDQCEFWRIRLWKLFKFALDPPTLASEEQGRFGSWARDLKDWGASPGVTDWDYFTLDDLSSFESTDFEYLSDYFHSYDRKRPGKINRHESEIQDPELLTDEARTSRRRARSLSQEPSPNDLVRPSKRTRYDISPLFTVIPQVRGLLA
ncbi:hypothetical protein SERLA73DRAFT_68510 [Serpula lacrymans var. lacrymans S7.3]|uniref:Uncharacterized protein n=1 Tax=Serpula lacrymans var. lacrymans (strain S7.3) TaxID=936435 RepID=F8PGD6_SERL3|nr:hypothetical protein SERLA73DRAFT_68510 [Serpula lacrymans var. lacrymans S7.3]